MIKNWELTSTSESIESEHVTWVFDVLSTDIGMDNQQHIEDFRDINGTWWAILPAKMRVEPIENTGFQAIKKCTVTLW